MSSPAQAPTAPVVEVHGLRMSYGGPDVVAGIDFSIMAGEIVAVLGPNGSGKTTTVEILEGLRDRTGGEVLVLGQDPRQADRQWWERIGIVLQESELVAELTVAEAVAMQAGYYPAPLDPAEVLDRVGLTEAADQRGRKLSGGQKRRLDLALALIGDPELVFLDEPTTGFDLGARREAWDMIAGLRTQGRTVLLTTHYMEEAERLADRIIIVANGRIVATGTPDELAAETSSMVMITWSGTEVSPPPDLGATLGPDGSWSIESSDVTTDLHQLTGWAIDQGVGLDGLRVRRPDLEDVFLELAEDS